MTEKKKGSKKVVGAKLQKAAAAKKKKTEVTKKVVTGQTRKTTVQLKATKRPQKKAQTKKKQPQKKASALLSHMRENFKRSLYSIQKDNKRAIKRKRTGKEIAVIIMAIIVVISILLPSFASFVSGNTAETPTSFSSTQEIFKPKVDELQAKFNEDPSNAEVALDLANEEYLYGTNAINFASTDDEKSQADAIMQKAVDDFTTYLNLAGALTTFDEKNAVVTRALCNLYLDNDSLAIQQLKDLLKETNFAPAWQGLGMIYESLGNNNQAIEAYQNAIVAPQEANQNVTSYCESRLKVLKAKNANSSGGAAALNSQLVS